MDLPYEGEGVVRSPHDVRWTFPGSGGGAPEAV